MLRVFDVQTCKLFKEFKAEELSGFDLRGYVLVTNCNAGVRVWNVQTGELLQKVQCECTFAALRLDAIGARLFAFPCSYDRVTAFDISVPNETRILSTVQFERKLAIAQRFDCTRNRFVLLGLGGVFSWRPDEPNAKLVRIFNALASEGGEFCAIRTACFRGDHSIFFFQQPPDALPALIRLKSPEAKAQPLSNDLFPHAVMWQECRATWRFMVATLMWPPYLLVLDFAC